MRFVTRLKFRLIPDLVVDGRAISLSDFFSDPPSWRAVGRSRRRRRYLDKKNEEARRKADEWMRQYEIKRVLELERHFQERAESMFGGE